MSILFVEGYDNMGALDGVTYGKWSSGSDTSTSGNTASRSLITGRFGSGFAIRHNAHLNFNGSAASQNLFPLGIDTQTIFVGFAFRDSGTTVSAAFSIMQLWDNTQANQFDVNYQNNGTLSIFAHGTTLATSSVLLSPANAWYWLELGVFISPTVGWAELRVNGVLTASYYGTGGSRGAANGNTRTTAVSSARFIWNGVSNGTNGTTMQNDYDDWVANDNNGSVNNDFMGEVRIIGLLPNALGTHSDFARVGGSVAGNFTAVDENPIDGDTSYVASPTVGAIDTYKYPTLPTDVSQVFAVVSNLVARRDDAGLRSTTTRIRSGGSEADALTTVILPTTYHTTEQIMENNPVTALPWVISDVNAVESGPHVTA